MEPEPNTLVKQFIRYVIPSIAAQWVYALYNMVDGIFVARGVGEQALTAVNLSNPFLQLMFALSLLFAVGASTVTSSPAFLPSRARPKGESSEIAPFMGSASWEPTIL